MQQPPTVRYRPEITTRAGFLKLTEVPAGGDVKELLAEDRDSLLHLVFYIVYTQEGRQLLKAAQPADGKEAEERPAKTNTLRAALNAKFPALPNKAAIDMIVEAHFEAYAYTKTAAPADKKRHQAEYIRMLNGLAAELYDNALDHEFSMNW